MKLFAKLNEDRSIQYYSSEPKEDYQEFTIDESDAYFLPKNHKLIWIDSEGLAHTDKIPDTNHENRLNNQEDNVKNENKRVNNQLNSLENKIDNNINKSLEQSGNYAQNRVDDLRKQTNNLIEENNKILTPIKSYIGYDEAMYAAEHSNRPLLCVYPSETQPGKSVVMKSIYSYGNNKLPNIDRIEITNPNINNFQFNNVYASLNQQDKKIYLHGSITYKTTINAGVSIAVINLEDLETNNITGQWLQYQTIEIDTNIKRNKIEIKNQRQQNGTINLNGATINIEYNSSLKAKLPAGMPERFDVLEDGESIYDIKESPAMYYIPDGSKIQGYLPYGNNGFIAQKTPYSGGYIQAVPLSNYSTSYYYYMYRTSYSYGSYNMLYGSLVPYLTQDFVDYATKLRNVSQSSLIGSAQPRQTW